VLVGPAPEVFPERGVEALGPDDHLAKQPQGECRLVVREPGSARSWSSPRTARERGYVAVAPHCTLLARLLISSRHLARTIESRRICAERGAVV
jgi:hypothetical protein